LYTLSITAAHSEMATNPRKVDLLNSQEHRDLRQVFHFKDVAVKHG
jgi:hypothetical protein